MTNSKKKLLMAKLDFLKQSCYSHSFARSHAEFGLEKPHAFFFSRTGCSEEGGCLSNESWFPFSWTLPTVLSEAWRMVVYGYSSVLCGFDFWLPFPENDVVKG
ncbi:hypothetical protein BaRGS_00028600 [Batillaria attramentaria]|uniref:Uncharacterized protein n=1 Tax=Batillaria attramentaria TaxID=370345 RepID=A0ABD0JZA6_9CAEN